MRDYPRLNRLFAADGRCFDVAIDHGFFNEPSFLVGIENIASAVRTIRTAAPDAIQLTAGQAHHLQDLPGRDKPSLVLRTDVANVYGQTLPDHVFSQLIADPIEQAIQLDAACVVVNLFLIPQRADLYHQCVANIAALKPLCVRFGMPLMVEPLVMQPNEKVRGYMVDGDIEKIVPLVRQAVELGADIIKADPCDDLTAYHRVIETAAGIPVLVRGGGRATDEEIMARTYAVMQEGAAGIVYGRNVVQHRNPRGMTQALMAIVHENATPSQASALLLEAKA
jgi:DhnA family fructose-bisphosphate aldolase class Ia